MFSTRIRFAAAAAALLIIHGCAVSPVMVSPEETYRIAAAKTVLVETSDGRQTVLKGASYNDNKIKGINPAGAPWEADVSRIRAVFVEDKNNLGFLPVLGCVAGATAWLVIGAATAPSPPPAPSCPFIYTFDGANYVFEAEPYGAAICRALQRAEWIGLDRLRPAEGRYRLRLANELEETEHVDEIKLAVADLAPGHRAVPDAAGRFHDIAALVPPTTARDEDGHDLREALSRTDGIFWEPAYETSPGLRNEIVLEFPKPAGARTVKLVANAWTTLWGSQVAEHILELRGSEADAWLAQVDRMGPEYRDLMNWFATTELYLLKLDVETAAGWKSRGTIFGGGPFMAKDKAYVLDIGDVTGDVLRVRLRPPTGFWKFDSLSVDYSEDVPVTVVEEAPQRALDERGTDVRSLLAAGDRNYWIVPEGGHFADLEFAVPPQAPGTERSIVLKASGYYTIRLNGTGQPRREILARILARPDGTLEFARHLYETEKAAGGRVGR